MQVTIRQKQNQRESMSRNTGIVIGDYQPPDHETILF
jgi:hypothetical protein